MPTNNPQNIKYVDVRKMTDYDMLDPSLTLRVQALKELKVSTEQVSVIRS
jgi:hypothetical protein